MFTILICWLYLINELNEKSVMKNRTNRQFQVYPKGFDMFIKYNKSHLPIILKLTLIFLVSSCSSLTWADDAKYKLAGVILCSTSDEAKNILEKAGYQYSDSYYTKETGKVRQGVVFDTQASDANPNGLVRQITYSEVGKYSPIEIATMVNQEKQWIENLYGKPVECDSNFATVYSFSCYYGDPKKIKPWFHAVANKRGKQHTLTIKSCNNEE